jgi:hypothetical protein
MRQCSYNLYIKILKNIKMSKKYQKKATKIGDFRSIFSIFGCQNNARCRFSHKNPIKKHILSMKKRPYFKQFTFTKKRQKKNRQKKRQKKTKKDKKKQILHMKWCEKKVAVAPT